jgi:hypothetical protein
MIRSERDSTSGAIEFVNAGQPRKQARRLVELIAVTGSNRVRRVIG